MKLGIGAGVLWLAACGSTAPPPAAVIAPAPPKAVAGVECVPYLVGLDLEPVDVLPAAQLSLAGALDVVAVVDGVYEVAAAGQPALRGYAFAGGAAAQLSTDRDFEPGIRGLRGGAVELDRAVAGGVSIWGPGDRRYQVPCDALATAPLDPPARPPEPRFTASNATLSGAGDRALYQTISEPVEVIAERGDQVDVRLRAGAFEITGTMSRDALEPFSPDAFQLSASRTHHERTGPLAARAAAAWCGDQAVLRAGAPVSSGPASDATSRELFRTREPADVRVSGSEGDARVIEIDYPVEPIGHALAWVLASDLDHPTCAPSDLAE